MRILKLALFLLLLRPFPAAHRQAVASEECNGGIPSVEWRTLTKRNYSSEIRLHPHLLLLVTVPWCGESRSLMKALGHALTIEPCKFGSLKLRVLFRNNEKMLADALGANNGISVVYYHHSVYYKYRGRLRAHNILSSIHYVMSLLPEELPLKAVNTPEELKDFLGSTDKALLLFEFCGWTHKVLASRKNNGTDYRFGLNEEYHGASVIESKIQQESTNEKMDCNIDDESGFIPHLNKFSLGNESAILEAENMSHDGSSCEIKEFLENDADDDGLSLPVNKPSILLFVDRYSDLLTLREDSKKAMDAFRELALQYHNSHLETGKDYKISEKASIKAIQELSTSKHPRRDLFEAAQKINVNDKMSIVIMNEGSHVSIENLADIQGSSLHEILTYVLKQKKELKLSKIAKGAGFELLSEDLNIKSGVTFAQEEGDHSDQVYESPKGIAPAGTYDSEAEHQSDQLSRGNPEGVREATGGLDRIQVPEKENTSHGENVAQPEFPGAESFEQSSDKSVSEHPHVQEAADSLVSGRIFGLEIEEENQEKMVNMENVQSLVAQREDHSNNPSERDSRGVQEATLDLDMIQVLERENVVYEEHVVQPEPTAHESFEQHTDKNFIEHSHIQEATDSSGDGRIFEKTLEVDEKKQERSFGGSFFFCDGQYRLLRTLTGGSSVPAAVIVDPSVQQHYVLDEQLVFNHSLLAEFLGRFIDGTLPPYQQSEPFAPSPRVAPNPPFVNKDFHEANSIPRVTANSFTELVLGNHSDTVNGSISHSQDVLVLFSNSWCGFCQRMELVVREVYRTILGYSNMLRTASVDDILNNTTAKLPSIYLMDCTLNDCSLILKPLIQREVYPLLLLFPAESKNSILYEGDIDVSEIIKFIAGHGNHSYGPIRDKDPLRTGSEDQMDQVKQNDIPHANNLYHEILLKDTMLKSRAKYPQISSSLNSLHQTPLQVDVGSMLTATYMLLNSNPFGESKILIVKGDMSYGYEGLIVNKRLSWESLEEIEEGLEFLKMGPLSYGGPVMRPGMPLVALTKRSIEDRNYPEVLPHIYFIDQVATLHLLNEMKSGNQSVNGFWFFLGFSSWSGNQLVNEIIEGAWTLNKGNEEQLDWPFM
ncbi:hypothetical protein DM860_001758 [Cuscuta australis]|uniref:Thioredoxin domain-containing protein n=1 Tax=Cuscuta australis TaxID=267555 RepID=A0A328EAH6_9ASTE|nr:hypothetical protein DM860_001758 [Cuscuta australis]